MAWRSRRVQIWRVRVVWGLAGRSWRGEIGHGVSSFGEFGSGEARPVIEVNNLCTKGE